MICIFKMFLKCCMKGEVELLIMDNFGHWCRQIPSGLHLGDDDGGRLSSARINSDNV